MTPSIVNVGSLTTDFALAGLLADLEDGGTTGPRLLLFDGAEGAWNSAFSGDISAVELVLSRVPWVLVGIIRGRCAGWGRALACRMDVVFGVTPVMPSETPVPFTSVADEATVGQLVRRLSDALQTRPDAGCVAAAVLRQSAQGPTASGLVREALAYSMLQAGPEHQSWLRERTHAL